MRFLTTLIVGALVLPVTAMAQAIDYIAGRGIAHSEVMVIDSRTVITGSFNWSRAAETTNAENLLIFHDSAALAGAYTAAWVARAKNAQPY